MRITDDGNEDITFIVGCLVALVVEVVLVLRISLWLFPPKKLDNWVSKPVTGWSNLNPMKMATYGQIETEAGYPVKKKGKFKGVG